MIRFDIEPSLKELKWHGVTDTNVTFWREFISELSSLFDLVILNSEGSFCRCIISKPFWNREKFSDQFLNFELILS